MLFLFYGPDEFRINQKIKEIADAYHKKYPNIEAGKISSFENFKEELKKLYLFAPKRLFIITDNSITNEYLEFIKSSKLASNPDIFLIFTFSKLEKGNKLFDYLIKNAKSQFLGKLTVFQLKRHIINDLESAGFKVLPQIAEKLVFLCDNSFENVLNELEKLKIYKHGGKLIDEKDLSEICVGAGLDINIFNLLDALNERDKIRIFSLFERYNLNNENSDDIFYQILAQLKKIFAIKLFLQNQPAAAEIIASKLRLHPFVVKKISMNIREFALDELKNILLGFLRIDEKIKTGRFKSADLLPRLLMEI